MGSVVVKAIEAVRCIRSGMTDAALMDEFGLSIQGLQQLFNQLLAAGLVSGDELEERLLLSQSSVIIDIRKERFPRPEAKKPVISALEALDCIRSGMDDTALMRRYNLSANGVNSLLQKLVASKVITRKELEKRSVSAAQSFVLEEVLDKPPEKQKDLTDDQTTEILARLRQGTTHLDVMEQFDMTHDDLDWLLDTLVQRGVVSSAEVEEKLREPLRRFEIRNRFTGKVIHGGESTSLLALVESAVRGGVNLSQSDLSGSNLFRAKLIGAQLERADLSRSNLMRADFTGARMVGAKLYGSDMTGAILYKTNLAGADLSDANLSVVYGHWVFLKAADLSEANFTNADLTGANLSGARMFETILQGTILTGAYWKT